MARLIHRFIFITTVLGIRIAELLRYYVPIITAFIIKTYRFCLFHAARLIHRFIFITTVLGIRIAELLRYYIPIITAFIIKTFRLCLDHTLRFVHRTAFMATVLGIRIMEFLRHYIPMAWQFLKYNTIKISRHAVRLIRLCLDLCSRFLRRTAVVFIRFSQITCSLLRHYVPVILHFLGARLRTAWYATVRICRLLFRYTVNSVRAVVQGFMAACILAARSIRNLIRRLALAATAIGSWFIVRTRYYLPLLLQSTGRWLQGTAQALVAACRWCAQNAARLTLATVRIILGVLAFSTKIFLRLLQAVKNILLFAGRSFITSCRRAGQYLWLGTRRLSYTSRNISSRVGERLSQYVLLTRLNKPIGILLLLWPTMWALWIAGEGTPDMSVVLIFIGGVILMRSAGCVINDLADRDFDAHVSRTQQRPLATGKVAPQEALLVAGVLILCAFFLVLQLNRLTIALSVVGALLAIMYPLTKRYTYMPQLFLGLAFGWAVPMAFAAQTGTVPAMGWILMMATVLWALVYDTMYAMVDRDEDIRLGIKSTAILFEDADRIIIGVIQSMVVLTLVLVGSRLGFNRFYYAGLAIAALLFIYQQHLIRDRVPAQCFMAFLNNHWFGAMVFGGILMNYHYE